MRKFKVGDIIKVEEPKNKIGMILDYYKDYYKPVHYYQITDILYPHISFYSETKIELV